MFDSVLIGFCYVHTYSPPLTAWPPPFPNVGLDEGEAEQEVRPNKSLPAFPEVSAITTAIAEAGGEGCGAFGQEAGIYPSLASREPLEGRA